MRPGALALGMTLLLTSASAQKPPVTLESLRDHARPLLLFAKSPEDPQLRIQLRTLGEHAAEAQERQIVPIAVLFNSPASTEASLTQAEAITVRRRFRIAPDEFVVLLIGKDGGEKLRDHRPLTIEHLIDTIDAMPMRQEEVRRKRKP